MHAWKEATNPYKSMELAKGSTCRSILQPTWMTLWLLNMPNKNSPKSKAERPTPWGWLFQIIATSHECSPQNVAEKGKPPYFREIQVGEILYLGQMIVINMFISGKWQWARHHLSWVRVPLGSKEWFAISCVIHPTGVACERSAVMWG